MAKKRRTLIVVAYNKAAGDGRSSVRGRYHLMALEDLDARTTTKANALGIRIPKRDDVDDSLLNKGFASADKAVKAAADANFDALTYQKITSLYQKSIQ